MKSRLPNIAYKLVSFSLIDAVFANFIGTFFIFYIMQSAAKYTTAISVFSIFIWLFTGVFFALTAKFMTPRNKMLVYRAACLMGISFLSIIILFGSMALNYIWFLGALKGLYVAFVYMPYNTMVAQNIPAPLMARYQGIQGISQSVAKIAFPILLGLIITGASYESTAWLIIPLFAIGFILSFTIRPPQNSAKQRPTKIIGFIKSIRKHSLVRRMLSVEFLRGLSHSGVMATVITMYIKYLFGTPLNLGILTSVFAAVTIAFQFLVGAFAKKSHFPRILKYCALLFLAASATFLIWENQPTFIFYNFCFVTTVTLISMLTDINVFNVCNMKIIKNQKVEYLAVREIVLNLGRVTGFLGLLMIGLFGGDSWLRWFLAALCGIVIVLTYMSAKNTKKIKICY